MDKIRREVVFIQARIPGPRDKTGLLIRVVLMVSKLHRIQREPMIAIDFWQSRRLSRLVQDCSTVTFGLLPHTTMCHEHKCLLPAIFVLRHKTRLCGNEHRKKGIEVSLCTVLLQMLDRRYWEVQTIAKTFSHQEQSKQSTATGTLAIEEPDSC